jgi:peptide/nickel transport system permease protein
LTDAVDLKGVAVAPQMPDILPPVKRRGGMIGLLLRHPTVSVGGGILVLLVLMAVAAPLLFTVDPTSLAPSRRLRPPSAEYWFGSDMLGRDIYSRVVYGARVSLIVGISVAALASIAGLFIGLIAGFIRFADGIIMRVMDGLMSIPPILLAIALMATSFSRSPLPKSRAYRALCAALCCRCANRLMSMPRLRAARAPRSSSCAISCQTRWRR